MFERLKTLLSHPLTRDLSIDDPQTTVLRAEIIREKEFLRSIYRTWYHLLIESLPPIKGPVVEIGSGAGFLNELYPPAITSEVFCAPTIDLVCSGTTLPFKPAALRSLLLIDALHHIPDTVAFFSEATRCVGVGGRCLMIEPWNTPWSRWVYNHLHHEPFDETGGWTLPVSGPLSGANGALPWILFVRDREIFDRRFPEWKISGIVPMMPVSYLLSGGISLRAVIPGQIYPFVRKIESLFGFEEKAAMFAMIILDRI